MCDERRVHEVELYCGGIGGLDDGGEIFVICQGVGHIGEAGVVGAEIRRGEGFDAELGGEVAGEGVELVGVAPREKDASVLQQVGGGMVDAGDVSAGERLESVAAPVVGLVELGGLHGVGSRAPPLRAIGSAVDDQHVARGEQHHVAHGAPLGEVLHGPAGVVCEGRDSATSI